MLPWRTGGEKDISIIMGVNQYAIGKVSAIEDLVERNTIFTLSLCGEYFVNLNGWLLSLCFDDKPEQLS